MRDGGKYLLIMDKTTGERIAKRAYELFLARGGMHGYHMEDWLAAEREINGQNREKQYLWGWKKGEKCGVGHQARTGSRGAKTGSFTLLSKHS